MKIRFAVIPMIILNASLLRAQSAHRQSLRVGLRVPLGRAAHDAAVCDGTEMAGVQSRRRIGTIMVFGGLGIIVASPTLAHGTNPNAAVNAAEFGLLVSGVGVFLHYHSNPSDGFWQSALAHVKVGETRAEEVRQCFGAPNGTVSSGADATWTYNTSKATLLGMGGSARSVSISLKDGIVSKVSNSEYGY